MFTYLLGNSKHVIIMQKLAKYSASVVVCLVVCFGETEMITLSPNESSPCRPVFLLLFLHHDCFVALTSGQRSLNNDDVTGPRARGGVGGTKERGEGVTNRRRW